MKNEVYNLDQLRRIIRNLQKENDYLKETLNSANIPFESFDVFQDETDSDNLYDPEQEERIIERKIDSKLANYFFSMFWGRTDVYAKRSKNGNYFPQCINRWNDICPKNKGKFPCENCEYKKWKSLSKDIIENHLKGLETIGVYPLLENGTCRFIVFDFDNHEKDDDSQNNDEWKQEVNTLRIICEKSDVDCLIERSRSGNGAHVWIFFSEPVSAKLARNFAFALLEKGMSTVNVQSFKYYDRIFPTQDYSDGIGNLIALPLQGEAVRKGNTVFVDENWNAYPDQWDILLRKTRKISKSDVENYIVRWQAELYEDKGILGGYNSKDRIKPWKKNDKFIKEDIVGKLHLVLADGVYVDTLNLAPRLQNQIRSFAVLDNPVFYKNKNIGISNYKTWSTIYLGKDVNGYIKLPRSLKDRIITECSKANIEYDIEDERETGRPIRVSFKGDLIIKQTLAANDMYECENGILNAATGFGKTVVGTYLISKRKVSTLIIVHREEILEQWKSEIEKFLEIREKLPEYTTEKGKIKTRDSVIGELRSGKNTLNGVVDIAMIGSLYNKVQSDDLLKSYGMVLIDECHHSAANTFVEVLKKIDAKYIYGFSATLKRSDNLDIITNMMIGPVIHEYSALQRSKDNQINHYYVPRFTRMVDLGDYKNDINKAYENVCYNKLRNEQIVFDVKECISNNLTPLVLTKYKKHAEILYESLQKEADHVLLLYGNNTDSKNREIRNELKTIPDNESVILIATMQKVGEGFDYPRLDVLVLTSPVSDESRLTQYVGRIDRLYKNKESVYVYDYVDSHIPVFEAMYRKRLKTYKKIGFNLYQGNINEKKDVRAIYSYDNYSEAFENDLIEADERIVISSPDLTRNKVERIIDILSDTQQRGVSVTVVTNEPDNSLLNNSDLSIELIAMMKNYGINVIEKEYVEERFAVIDNNIVWHGSTNLLGKEDVEDNLIRVKDERAASELLEIVFGYLNKSE